MKTFTIESISEILTSASRFSQSQNGLDSQCRMLRQIFEGCLPPEKQDHRTAVLILSGLKCLDQYDWLQIQCGDISQQIQSLIQQIYDADDDAQRKKLLIKLLVQVKVLAHAQMIGNEIYIRASEYMLQTNTFILARISRRDDDLMSFHSLPAQDAAVKDQLVLLRNVVDEITGELAICSNTVNSAYAHEDDSLEAEVQFQSLRQIISFGIMVANHVSSLADVAINTIATTGSLPPKEARLRTQWLTAYAMTAATVAGACNSMVRDAFMAYGSITEVERQGHRAPSDSPQPGQGDPHNN